MKYKPKISIIVPMYNVENYISECIISILGQQYNNLQLVLVNDGSTDSTYKLCEDFAARDSRIKLISQKNKGVSSARNLGIKLAEGDYLIFVDADDYLLEGFSEFILNDKIMESDLTIFNNGSDSGVVTKFYKDKIPLLQLATMGLKNAICTDFLASPCCKIYKSEIIKSNRLEFNKKLKIGEDLLFNLEYEEFTESFLIIDKKIYFYRVNEQSVTQRFLKDFLVIDYLFQTELKKYINTYDKDWDFQVAGFESAIRGMLIALKKYYANRQNKKSIRKIYSSLDYMVHIPVYKEALSNYGYIKTNYQWNERMAIFMLGNRKSLLLLSVCLKIRGYLK